jgi:hypothetical protein
MHAAGSSLAGRRYCETPQMAPDSSRAVDRKDLERTGPRNRPGPRGLAHASLCERRLACAAALLAPRSGIARGGRAGCECGCGGAQHFCDGHVGVPRLEDDLLGGLVLQHR